jgi:hypothetical protein
VAWRPTRSASPIQSAAVPSSKRWRHPAPALQLRTRRSPNSCALSRILGKQVGAQLGLLNNILAMPSSERDEKGVKAVNASIE